MNIKKWVITLAIAVGVLLLPTTIEAGKLKTPEVFRDGKWTYIGETGKFEDDGQIQSMCVTRDYIICIEDASNKRADNDTLVAFYKNEYDANGNPVEQYSYAFHVSDRDYEHGNGMTYNNKDNKVIIASGPVLDRKNLGTVYILDADTLKFEKQVSVMDNGEPVFSIDYLEETDQYIMMTGTYSNGEATYQFILTDSQFRVLDTIMKGDRSEGNKFQDFCVSGDYLICLPYFAGGRAEQRIQLYSISERKWIDNYPLIFAEDMTSMEPEGICEIAPGHFMVGTVLNDPRRIGFYSLQVPVVYNIKTSIENGTISEGSKSVDYGSKFKVEYTPDEGYEIKEIWVNGTQEEVKKYIQKYTFNEVDSDQSIKVICTKIPQYHVSGRALNGTIDEEILVYENRKVQINFEPEEHYRLKSVFVDGQLVDVAYNATYYEFEKVTEDHDVYVEFEKMSEYAIKIRVQNGYTKETEVTVYEGDNYTVEFKPKKNYILEKVLIDEQVVSHEEDQTTYEFKLVYNNHKIEIIYRWQYLYQTVVAGGIAILAVVVFIGSIHFKRRRKRNRNGKEAQ